MAVLRVTLIFESSILIDEAHVCTTTQFWYYTRWIFEGDIGLLALRPCS